MVKEGRFAGVDLRAPIITIYDSEKVRMLKLPHYGEIVKILEIMQRNGMCMFTGARMLNFVTRLYERGVISRRDTGGLELRTADVDAYISLLEKWVNREGIGDYMARGWYALSERVGVDAATDFEDGVPIVRGAEVLHDIRWGNYGPALFLSQVIRPKPLQVHQRALMPVGRDIHHALHEIRSELIEKIGLSEVEAGQIVTDEGFNTGALLRHTEEAEIVNNMMGVCIGGGPEDPGRDMPFLAEVYAAATGFSATAGELKVMAEKQRNIDALLNLREGIMGKDYDPPQLWLQHTEKPVKVGSGDLYATDWLSGKRITRDDMYTWMRDYYNARGWDTEKRIPTREKLQELGLAEYGYILEPYSV